MRKFRIFLSLDSEENWINSVQENGYELSNINLFNIYHFRKRTSIQDFNPYVRLDFREKGMKKDQYYDYITMFSDSGWDLLKGSRLGGIQYFKQNNIHSDREIFSDNESKNALHKRYSRFGSTYGLLFLIYGYLLSQMQSINLFNFRTWYLTPGIWSMQGSTFFKAFFFETPFVILRTIPLLVFMYLGILYLCRSITNKENK